MTSAEERLISTDTIDRWLKDQERMEHQVAEAKAEAAAAKVEKKKSNRKARSRLHAIHRIASICQEMDDDKADEIMDVCEAEYEYDHTGGFIAREVNRVGVLLDLVRSLRGTLNLILEDRRAARAHGRAKAAIEEIREEIELLNLEEK